MTRRPDFRHLREAALASTPWRRATQRERHLNRRLDRLERAVEKLREASVDGAERTREVVRLQREATRITEPVRLDYPRAEIHLTAAGRKRARAGAKEPWTVSWIETMGPADVLYDVGANVGAYSLIAGSGGERAPRVIAFEPAYHSFAALCDNIALNGLDERIEALPVALGSSTGLARLLLSSREAATASHQLALASSDLAALEDDVEFRQTALAYRLDDLVDQFRLPPPTHLKLDVDGSEIEVLEGARATLAGSTLVSVMVEVPDTDAARIAGTLSAQGFDEAERFERVSSEGTRAPYSYVLYARARSG